MFQGQTEVYLVPPVYKMGTTILPGLSVIGNRNIVTVPVKGVSRTGTKSNNYKATVASSKNASSLLGTTGTGTRHSPTVSLATTSLSTKSLSFALGSMTAPTALTSRRPLAKESPCVISEPAVFSMRKSVSPIMQASGIPSVMTIETAIPQQPSLLKKESIKAGTTNQGDPLVSGASQSLNSDCPTPVSSPSDSLETIALCPLSATTTCVSEPSVSCSIDSAQVTSIPGSGSLAPFTSPTIASFPVAPASSSKKHPASSDTNWCHRNTAGTSADSPALAPKSKSQLILPRPSAILLPIKLELEPKSKYFLAGQNGPLIFVTDARAPCGISSPSTSEENGTESYKKDIYTQTVATTGASEASTTSSRAHRRGTNTRKGGVNVGIQTPVGMKQQSAMGTQTTGDSILHRAMRSANLPVQKQSQASQVSPCAKLKQSVNVMTQDEMTGTEGLPKGVKRKRRRRTRAKETGIQTAPWKQTVSTETFSLGGWQFQDQDISMSSMPISAFRRPGQSGQVSVQDDLYTQMPGAPVTSVLSIQTDTAGFDTMSTTSLQYPEDLILNRTYRGRDALRDRLTSVSGNTAMTGTVSSPPLMDAVEVGTVFTPPLRGPTGVGTIPNQTIGVDTMPSPLREPTSVATMPSPPLRETIGVGTMPSLPLRETIGVGTIPSPPLRETIGVGTMPSPPLRETIGVGTMPSPPLRETIGVGTMPSPPLQGFDSVSPQPQELSLSLPFSTLSTRETQTSFWEELEATLAESISTQTLRSYLAETGDQDPTSLSLMDNSVQTTIGQSIETQTWDLFDNSVTETGLFDINPDNVMRSVGIDTPLFDTDSLTNAPRSVSVGTMALDDFSELQSRSIGVSTPMLPDLTEESQSRSVGVGTSLFDIMESEGQLCPSGEEPSVFEPIETDVLSRSVGIDTQLFDSYDPGINSRSIGICTPLFDNFETTYSRDVAIGTSMFSATASHQATQVQGDDIFGDQRTNPMHIESNATASVQTDTESTFPNLLTSSSQTTDFDTSYMHMETQTMGEMFSQLLSNMETQTSEDFLSDLGFANIQTQTPVPNMDSNPALDLATVETQTTFQLCESSDGLNVNGSMDMETQTLFPELDGSVGPLTDSHTQTTWDGLESLLIGDLGVD